ncbi:MAG: hypothetical protein AB7I18_12315 [Candidatus Berkiella sp.]
MAKTPQKAAKETVENNPEVAAKNGENGPKFAENRKKLQKKLELHSEFVRMLSWAVGIVGLYFMGQLLWSLKNSILLKIPFDMVFGTATSSGIPVAMMKAVLPAALAPAAPLILIGGIAAFWGYQLAYTYFNENLFSGAPKKAVSAESEKAESPEKDLKQHKAATPIKALQSTPKVTSKPVANKQAPAKQSAPKVNSKPVAHKKAPAKQGRGRAIVSAFNHQQRQTRSMTKAAKEQAEALAARAKPKRPAKK